MREFGRGLLAFIVISLSVDAARDKDAFASYLERFAGAMFLCCLTRIPARSVLPVKPPADEVKIDGAPGSEF
jgi:hypothetical protein